MWPVVTASGLHSRHFRLTFSYSSATRSQDSYISLPVDFWEGSRAFEQLGLSSVPVEQSLCWSLAPSEEGVVWERGEAMQRRRSVVMVESVGMQEEVQAERGMEYVPFVVGTSIVASGVVKLGLVAGGAAAGGGKNSVRLLQPKEKESGELRVVYDFRAEGNVVLIPGVPAILTPADFLAFIQEAKGIVDLRLVREASPGKYMALIRLQSRRHAVRFADMCAGRPFSALEPDVCQVLSVAEIEFTTRVESVVPLFDMADFKDQVKTAGLDEFEVLLEVPSCPVCLDRLDASVTGIITTICSHSYHCECLLKWYDGRCPVCRFLLSEEDNGEGSRCEACGCGENLWVCLVCGNLGCGRYQARHAQAHFEATGHTFSLELESHRVWDYVGDNYVHRLVQNQDDGKLVEIATQPAGECSKHDDPDYISSLLVAQLESQRTFYEEKLSALEAAWSVRNKVVQVESADLIESLQDSIERLALQQTTEQDTLQQQLRSLEARIEALRGEKAGLRAALASESAMLESVMQSQAQLEATILEKERDIVALQEQVTDLLMHFEGQKAIDQSGLAEDLRAGTIRLVEPPRQAQPARRSKKR